MVAGSGAAKRAGLFAMVVTLVRRDLLVEWRTKETVWTAGLFGLVLLTVFVFSGFDERLIARAALPGVLWVSVAFVGTVVFSRSFEREHATRAMDALLLVPGALNALFVARLCTNLVLLGLVELVVVPLTLATFGVSLSSAGVAGLLAALLLGTLGYGVMGTVLAAALTTIRLKDALLPIVLFPLTIPLLVAGVRATHDVVGGAGLPEIRDWLLLMGAFDLLFAVIGRWLFVQTLDPELIRR